MNAPTERDVKKLFALSLNQCAFPGCINFIFTLLDDMVVIMKSLILILLALAATGGFAQTAEPELAQIKIAADAGDPAAQDKLAARVDAKQAEVWYRKAAEQGFVHAQGKLGDIYLMRGRLTIGLKPAELTVIADEAIKWATLAANQGDKQGQADLARIYLDGKWVKQDLVEAYKWGDLSANNPSLEFIVFSGASVRDEATLKMNADQIAEARKRVAEFKPHKPKNSDLPEPAWVQHINLGGISGTPGHRLAIINGKTFETGDHVTLKIDGKSVTVNCLDIREASVSISIEGMDGTRELRMPAK